MRRPTPIPPWPSWARIVYGPSEAPGVSVIGGDDYRPAAPGARPPAIMEACGSQPDLAAPQAVAGSAPSGRGDFGRRVAGGRARTRLTPGSTATVGVTITVPGLTVPPQNHTDESSLAVC